MSVGLFTTHIQGPDNGPITLTVPSDVIPGTALLAEITLTAGDGSPSITYVINGPGTWTKVRQDNAPNGRCCIALFTRIYQAGDPSTVNFSWTTSGPTAFSFGLMVSITQVNATNLVDNSAGQGDISAPSGTYSTPSFNTSQNGDTIFQVYGQATGNPSTNFPNTPLYNSGSYVITYTVQGTSGTMPACSVTNTDTGSSWVASTIAIAFGSSPSTIIPPPTPFGGGSTILRIRSEPWQ